MGKRRMQQEALDVNTLPRPSNEFQFFAKVISIRGGGLFDAEIVGGKTVLVELPLKFKNVFWVKLGGFVVLELLKEAITKVEGEIIAVLRPEHLKKLRSEGIDLQDKSTTEDITEKTEGEDLFVNRNRMHVEELSDESDEGDLDSEA